MKWTPVNKRLPTKPGTYLCTEESPLGRFVVKCVFNGGWHFHTNGAKIVAWMPYPKPYEEREEN